jgi:hypothetical protein
MRLLVTGSRDIPESREKDVWNAIISAIGKLYGNGDDEVVIVEGGCPTGADRYARTFVAQMKSYSGALEMPVTIKLESHPANWTPNGPGTPRDRTAGFKRNQAMVNLGADLCLAFYQKGAGNKGTSHCAEAAYVAGIPVESPKGFEKESK